MINNSKCAIFTLVRDEAVNLPIWLGYYSRYFGRDNIYVLDHESTDGSTENIEGLCRKETLHYPLMSERWKNNIVRSKQGELLKRYRYVILTDCDEIIIPDPDKYENLEDFILRAKEKSYRCKGYSLIQMKDKEPGIDLGRPILSQRNYWYPNSYSCKTLLSRVPLDWDIGLHEVIGRDQPISKELILLHLDRMDLDLYVKKHRHWLNYKWAEEDLQKNWDWHYRVYDAGALEDMFYGRTKGKDLSIMPDLIPDKWKRVI